MYEIIIFIRILCDSAKHLAYFFQTNIWKKKVQETWKQKRAA